MGFPSQLHQTGEGEWLEASKLDLVRKKKKNDTTGILKRATKSKEEICGEKTHSQAEPGIRSGDQETDYN